MPPPPHDPVRPRMHVQVRQGEIGGERSIRLLVRDLWTVLRWSRQEKDDVGDEAIVKLGTFWGTASYISMRRAANIKTYDAGQPKQITGQLRRYTHVYYEAATSRRFCSSDFPVGDLLTASV